MPDSLQDMYGGDPGLYNLSNLDYYDATPMELRQNGDQGEYYSTPEDAYTISSNGTKLYLDENNQFSDNYNNPNGKSEKDQLRLRYQYDPTTRSARAIGGNTYYQPSEWVSNGRDFTYTLGSVLAAGAGGALMGGAGAAGGGAGAAAGGATNAALIDSALGTAGYGASSAGAGGMGGFSLGGMGSSALKGAGMNAGSTAIQGGDWNDILKSAGYGAVGGAVGYGVGAYNPGSAVTSNVDYQNIINRGVSGGVNAGLRGGNVGTGALMGAGMQAGNVYGQQAWNGLTSPEGGGNMPDNNWFGAGQGDDINNLNLSGQNPYYQSSGDLGMQSPTTGNEYSPSDWGAGSGSQPAQQQASNPFKDIMQKALGFGGGSSASPKFGDMAGSLLGMYSAYQNKKKYGALANNLSSMFGPNSPYAQQLGNQLARRDAASGRRSQYGPREVELQARLAEMNSRNAPTLQSLYGAEQGSRNQMLNNGLQLGQQSGLGGMLGNYAQPWINSMFNQTPANSGPQLEG